MRRAGLILPVIFAGILAAEPGPKTAGGGSGLRIGIWQRDLPEMGKVTTGVLTAGEDTFLVMPPANWRLEADGAGSVRWLGPDRSSISIRLLTDAEARADGTEKDKLRQRAQSRLPGAKLLRETACHTEAESGAAFDLEWLDTQGGTFAARAAYVRVGGSFFEFCLLAPSGAFARDLGVFVGMLTSFQVAEPQRAP
ncbi:MAG: hypothetical protein KJ072_13060 [Verrucomicrobia bacterium]|nr:hypothetical protein [Verrucomicrobiota bacterium]